MNGREQPVAGAILVWSAVSPEGRERVAQGFGFAAVLSLEEMLGDPRRWDDVARRARSPELRSWSNGLFDARAESQGGRAVVGGRHRTVGRPSALREGVPRVHANRVVHRHVLAPRRAYRVQAVHDTAGRFTFASADCTVGCSALAPRPGGARRAQPTAQAELPADFGTQSAAKGGPPSEPMKHVADIENGASWPEGFSSWRREVG